MAGFFLIDVYSFWLYNIVIVSNKRFSMYIEMTTFAVPTFLITLLKIAVTVIGVWLLLAFIGIYFYNRNIAKQMEINAKIDSLHK